MDIMRLAASMQAARARVCAISESPGHFTLDEDFAFRDGALAAYREVVLELARDMPDVPRQVFLSIARVEP